MSFSMSSLFTPSAGGWLNFGMNIWSAGEKRAGQYKAAWNKWEADSARALRQAVHTNKQNFRAHQVDMTNWLAKSKHVSQLRQYENQLATDRAQLKTETSINATKALGRKYADLNARYYEEEASDTIQLETIRNKIISEGIKKSGVASGRVGRSVENISNTYNQQWLGNASNRQITRKFRIGDKMSAFEAANADALNKSNSVTLYNPRPYADPVQPLTPLEAELHLPSKPQVKSGLGLLDYAGAAMSAYNNYMSNKPPGVGNNSGSSSVNQSDAAAWAEDHGRSIEDANTILSGGSIETVID
tara:strand:+ start:370 stop:1275 length:906 start_codon:yes stop_codon:yes gene_type:complete